MNDDLQNSNFPITSGINNNNEFGTGFIIYQKPPRSYLLTCSHVLEDIANSPLVAGLPAKVVANGRSDTIDLAILEVNGLLDKVPLPLGKSSEKSHSIRVGSFSRGGNKKQFFFRSSTGRITKQIAVFSHKGQQAKGWELEINIDSEQGSSGSPVIE